MEKADFGNYEWNFVRKIVEHAVVQHSDFDIAVGVHFQAVVDFVEIAVEAEHSADADYTDFDMKVDLHAGMTLVCCCSHCLMYYYCCYSD